MRGKNSVLDTCTVTVPVGSWDNAPGYLAHGGKFTALPSAAGARRAAMSRRGSRRGPQGCSEAEAHTRHQEQRRQLGLERTTPLSWRAGCHGNAVCRADLRETDRSRRQPGRSAGAEGRDFLSRPSTVLRRRVRLRLGSWSGLSKGHVHWAQTRPFFILVPLYDILGPYHPPLLSHLPSPSCLRALGCLSRESLENPPP